MRGQAGHAANAVLWDALNTVHLDGYSAGSGENWVIVFTSPRRVNPAASSDLSRRRGAGVNDFDLTQRQVKVKLGKYGIIQPRVLQWDTFTITWGHRL